MTEDRSNAEIQEILEDKLQDLRSYLKSLGSVAIAFSSGVDSTFLLKVAHEVLGDKAIAITAQSHSFPRREREEAREFCEKEGIRQVICHCDELQIEGFSQNPPNRCYICKKALFQQICDLAKENQIAYVAEGSNMDDMGDYRPGLMAVTELGIKSPLREAKLTKAEIRAYSKQMGLLTWDKPSFACLSSRFAYGETITKEKLKMVEKAEELLLGYGFEQMRVRIHGLLARIEVLPEELPKLMEEQTRQEIYTKLKEYGFSYITVDLMGYRMGSMNEMLKK